MAILNLFSKRQKKLLGEVSDILTYNNLPQPLKVQIVCIIRDAIGEDMYVARYGTGKSDNVYAYLNKNIATEFGSFSLGDNNVSDKESVLNFLLQTKDVEKLLDVIEQVFLFIHSVIREDYHYRSEVKVDL